MEVTEKPVWIKIERRGGDAVLPGGWAVSCSDTQFCVTVTTFDEAIDYPSGDVLTDNASDDELRAFAAHHRINEVDAPKIEEPKGVDVTEHLKTLPKRHVCAALLSYDAKGFMRSSMALTNAIAKFNDLGWGFTYILREADSMVARGRSQLASRFLIHETCKDCTDLVFIDTDVYWDGDDLLQLMAHQVDVVAGAYPFKNEAGNFPLRWSSEGLLEEYGLWIVQAVTPGFLRISRHALQRMVHEMPWLAYSDSHGDADHKCWMFFDNLHRQNGVYDEGYVFCERWRGVGGKVYLDPDIDLKHIGMKIYAHGTIRQWNDEMTAEIERLHREYDRIEPGVLLKKLQENRQHWKRLKEVHDHEQAIGKMRLEIADLQALARREGKEPIRLPGLEYPDEAA